MTRCASACLGDFPPHRPRKSVARFSASGPRTLHVARARLFWCFGWCLKTQQIRTPHQATPTRRVTGARVARVRSQPIKPSHLATAPSWQGPNKKQKAKAKPGGRGRHQIFGQSITWRANGFKTTHERAREHERFKKSAKLEGSTVCVRASRRRPSRIQWSGVTLACCRISKRENAKRESLSEHSLPDSEGRSTSMSETVTQTSISLHPSILRVCLF